MTARPKKWTGEKPTKTTLVIPDPLLKRLKHAAIEEGTDVSSLLCRLAEDYLKRRKGGGKR